ncbi:MAG: hypothetical protein JO319_17480 [Acidobacteriaceae bacterium]|nr:hypothetical protein [Acidobacteriaceae bacterium]
MRTIAFRVVLHEASANVAGGYPYYGVAAGIVGSIAAENINAETSLLQPLPVPRKRTFNYVPEKLLTSAAPFKGGAVQNLS